MKKKSATESKSNFIFGFLLVLVAILLGIYIFGVIKRNIADVSSDYFITTRKDYYIVTAGMISLVLLLYKFFKKRLIYPVVALAGILFIFIYPDFAPIDEIAHFAYIHHIADHYDLPTLNDYVDNEILAFNEHVYPAPSSTDPSKIGFGGRVYEAFQPPLYYMIAALVYKIIPGNILVKFYAIRLFGLLCLLISIYVINKTYRLLVERQIIERNDFFFFSILLLFTLNPGVMVRMITVSNLHLLVPLTSLLLYALIKFCFFDNLKFKYHVIILTFLCGALLLTQFTSLFLIPLVLLFLFLKERYKDALKYVGLLALVTFPWFIFNYYHYGHMTANKIAKSMQKIIINPHNEKYGLTHIFDRMSGMLGTFWNPQEAIYPFLKEPNVMITNFLGICLVLVTAYFIFFIIRNYKKRDALFNVVFVSTLSVVLNFVLLISITIFESWDVMIGRYFYLNILPLFVLAYMFAADFHKHQKNVLSFTCIAMALFLCSNVFVKILDEREKDLLFQRERFVSFDLMPFNNNHIGHITKETKFTQTFISQEEGLIGIHLYISTFMQKNIKTPYKLIIKGEKCLTPLREKNLDVSKIKDNQFLKVLFPPIDESKGKTYCFTVEPDAEQIETPITLQLSAPDIYTKGEAVINGQSKREDIVFQLIYYQ